MDGRGLLSLVEQVERRLAARGDVFHVHEIEFGLPFPEAELAGVEADLGIQLPEPLRSFYVDVGRFLVFRWSVRRGQGEQLGCVGETPEGRLELEPVERLRQAWTPERRRDVPRVLRVTSDGYGDGYALAFDGARAPRVVWYTHDGEPKDAVVACHPSVEAWLTAWARVGFALGRATAALERFLAKP